MNWRHFKIKNHKAYYKTDIGYLEITGNQEGVLSIDFLDEAPPKTKEIHPSLNETIKQLDEYFKGNRMEFDVKIHPQLKGTEFQKKVWNELKKIPFGKTVSYRDIAIGVGNEKATRAVGNANRNNQIVIIIPCHRVVGSNGKLTGFGGGLWRKEWLLNHERKKTSNPLTSYFEK